MRRLLFVVLCLAVSAAYADKPGKGRGYHGDDDDRDEARYGRTSRGGAVIIFRPQDRRVIDRYYHAYPSSLPPGLAKRNGNLPPGLQKQLYRNGRLPPGLDKRITPFPFELEQQLPPLPGGYYRGIIGDQAVIYDPKTHLIVDAVNIAIAAARGH